MAKYKFLLDSHETPMKFHKGEVLEGTPDNVTKDNFINFKRPDGTTFFAINNFEVEKEGVLPVEPEALFIGGAGGAAVGFGIAFYAKMGIGGYVLTTALFAVAGAVAYHFIAPKKDVSSGADGVYSNYNGQTSQQVVRQQVVQQTIKQQQAQQHEQHSKLLQKAGNKIPDSENPNCHAVHQRGGKISYFCPTT